MSLISSQLDILGKTDREELKEQMILLKETIGNPNLEDGIRLRAIHLLGRIGDTESRKILYDTAKDTQNPWIKREINRILTTLETGEQQKPTFGVIFDVDGTLINKSKTKLLIHKAVLEAVGLKVTKQDIKLIENLQQEKSSNKKILATILEKHNQKDKLEEALKIRDAVKARVYKTFTKKELPLMKGARNLLEHLQRKRKTGEVRIAITGTGRTEIINHDFKIHNLSRFFDFIVALGIKDYLRERPHPDIFVEARDQLEKKFAVQKENIIIIDDRPESGLKKR